MIEGKVMADSDSYYSVDDVAAVAEMLRQQSLAYDQLFENLAKQMYVELQRSDSEGVGLSQCYQLAEQALSDFQQHFPSSGTLACHKGCAHCCHLRVETPPQVVADIAAYVQSRFSPEALDQLRQRLAEYPEHPELSFEKPPCPLLDQNQQCSIYPRRPPSCRAFTSPNVELCIRSVKQGAQVPQQPITVRVYQALTNALMAVAQQQGAAQQSSLVPALQSALKA